MQLDFLGDLRRTHMCGELRRKHDGQRVVLMGWVNRRRDMGNLIFIDLRGRTGITQLAFGKSDNSVVHEEAIDLPSEFVNAAVSKVGRLDPQTANRNIATVEAKVRNGEDILGRVRRSK